MSSKTKIVVLRMKEVIYTAIFVGLAILLLILCFIMFRPEKKAVPSASTLSLIHILLSLLFNHYILLSQLDCFS